MDTSPAAATSPIIKAKKISFISAIALVVGSAIGAGIFFKNSSILNSTQGNIGIAIGCWAVASVGIVAIGLALLEVASSSRKNKGLLGWTQAFTYKWFHSWSKGYLSLFYYPVTMVSLPVYAVQALTDASGVQFAWWQIILIALALTTWLMAFSLFSTKVGSGLNWLFTIAKFVPIFLVPIFGFIHSGDNGADGLVVAVDTRPSSLTAISPYMGLMAAIPAIFFAFDGFYTVASITSDLKRPKSMPWAMTIGILIITAVYLLISAGVFLSSSSGSATDVQMPEAAKKAVNYGIFLAVTGIANGYGFSTFKSYDDAIVERDFVAEKTLLRFGKKAWFATLRQDGTVKRKFLVNFSPGFIFFTITILAWYAIFTVIAAFNDYDGSGYGGAYAYSPTGIDREDALYSLADLLTNWSSLIIFVLIAAVLIGAIKNRLKKRVEVVSYAWFIPTAVISIVFVAIATLYLLANTIAGATGFMGADGQGNGYYLIILVLSIALGFAFNLYYWLKGRRKSRKPWDFVFPLSGAKPKPQKEELPKSADK